METTVLDNFTAISFLANGEGFYSKPILLKNVSWQEYECFLKDFEEKAGWRLTYDKGDLEFMPPLREHEKPKDTIFRFVHEYCLHFDVPLETSGSTTFRRKSKEKGIEPDTCFYIQSADENKDIGKNIKPEDYLVPDVAVEIDVTHGSLDKFKIYAALGVPELWLYDGKDARFYLLENDKYHESEKSQALSQLSASILTEFLRKAEKNGQTAALKEFRFWLQNQNVSN